MTLPLRPLAALTGAVLQRLARRRMVRRALAWPGLLTAGALLLAVAFSAYARAPDHIVAQDPVLAAALQARSLTVLAEDPDPTTAVSARRALRAAYRPPADAAPGTVEIPEPRSW